MKRFRMLRSGVPRDPQQPIDLSPYAGCLASRPTPSLSELRLPRTLIFAECRAQRAHIALKLRPLPTRP